MALKRSTIYDKNYTYVQPGDIIRSVVSQVEYVVLSSNWDYCTILDIYHIKNPKLKQDTPYRRLPSSYINVENFTKLNKEN